MTENTEYIVKERLCDIVANKISSKIHSGEWAPGMMLPSERSLSDMLGVSRTVLRDALSDKKVSHLLEIRSGHKYVRQFALNDLLENFPSPEDLDATSILEIMEVRAALEAFGARKAALNITPMQLERLQKNVDEMAVLMEKGEYGIPYENRFHHEIAEATSNAMFLRIYNMIDSLLSSTRNITWQVNAEMGVENTAVSDHQAILDAIRKHDSYEAGVRMEMHLSKARERIENLLQE